MRTNMEIECRAASVSGEKKRERNVDGTRCSAKGFSVRASPCSSLALSAQLPYFVLVPTYAPTVSSNFRSGGNSILLARRSAPRAYKNSFCVGGSG